jgi:hypothetical protein
MPMPDYFSHDYNARNDPKLIRLQIKMGMEGIGIFWCLIELMYEQEGYLLLSQYECYAFAIRTNYDKIKSVIEDFDLFENDSVNFWNESVLRRLKMRNEKSENARKSVNKRWLYERNTTVSNVVYDGNTIKESKEIKEKKVNKEFSPPPLIEIESYFFEKGYTKDHAKRFFDYYSTANWHDGRGAKLKNWKQKAIAVWFKDEGKIGMIQGKKEESSQEALDRIYGKRK